MSECRIWPMKHFFEDSLCFNILPAQPSKTDEICSSPFSVRTYLPSDHSDHCIVVLDDELIGDIVIGAARMAALAGLLPPVAIISVGFGAQRFDQLHKARGRYFTFNEIDLSVVGLFETGDAETLRCFLDQYLPTVLASLNIDPGTLPGLMGYSLSGYFALDMKMRYPDLFGALATFSPSLWVNMDETVNHAETYSIGHGGDFYLATGSLENVSDGTDDPAKMKQNARRIADLLGGGKNSRVHCEEIEGADHTTVVPLAVSRALAFLLE